MHWQTGYCTNVHAGRTFEETHANLERHALAVREKIAPDGTMGIGLWLANSAAREMLQQKRVGEFGDFLSRCGLVPYTLNGFPFGDFHSEVVRHNVYLPTWGDQARTDYTLTLVEILDQLLPPGAEGSISTVPIAWGQPPLNHEQLSAAAQELRRLAEVLRELEQKRNRLIHVAIEPEPGCVLQRSTDIAYFFERYLFQRDAEMMRRYIRVCHDVCHASVMFEEQHDVLRHYRNAGVLVGKVQVSSAVVLQLDRLSREERNAAMNDLSQFAEPRYLHQTVVRRSSGDEIFFEDLPLALQSVPDHENASGEWRVHFHVPVYLEKFGIIGTSQSAILECLRELDTHGEVQHLEVETYAWNVLPQSLRVERLSDGIADEMLWLTEQIRSLERDDGAKRASDHPR